MRVHDAAAIAALGTWLVIGFASPAAARWVTFPASAAPGAPLASARGASPVRGYLGLPTDSGRHPAVVMLPSCEGRRPFHQSWAQVLSERGYVTLLVDHHFMQDHTGSCASGEPAARAGWALTRLQHAAGAARFLAGRPEVDAARIAVMGWGDAPVAGLVGAAGAGVDGVSFSAGIVVTPARCEARDLTSSRPVLIIEAEMNPARGDGACESSADSPTLTVRVYDGTWPGFDDPQGGSASASGDGPVGTTRARYDRLAHLRAIEDVSAFLGHRLEALAQAVHDRGSDPIAAASREGTWAVDPGEPGPDLPPLGVSAFDAVFSRVTATGVIHEIPFPFTRLLETLGHAAGSRSMSRSPLDATLIPLGRSLQREAAAPDYFRSPRIVVAVTGEPAAGVGPLGVRLKNRLFLGYQPRAEVVEVISYNALAGRFEFQIVRDYAAGRRPRAHYARRALCTSCHQNAAPIFAEAGWDETTANADVAARLGALGTSFHGVPVSDVDRAVTAIDIATDEANLLPVYQRLWSQGCASVDRTQAARCRAGALQAMLQYRLSNAAGFDRAAPLYEGAYLPVQRANWRLRWPRGLLLPNPNLPNRSPLMSPVPSAVPGSLDPLRPRAPLARWTASSDRDLDRFVRGLSHSVPERHVLLLDRYLRESDRHDSRRSLTAPCKARHRGVSGHGRLLEIECGGDAGARAPFRLRAQLRTTLDGTAEGESSWIELDGGAYDRVRMTGRVEQTGAAMRVSVQLRGRDGEPAPRAPDGDAIAGLELAWNGADVDGTRPFGAVGTLHLAGDFQRVSSLLQRLAEEATATSALLADRFDGPRHAEWLLAQLGIAPAAGCCELRPAPEPALEVGAGAVDAALSVALEHRGPLLTLRRYCGACHGGDTAYPPGFLHGGDEAVLRKVAACAERIYYRLSMWRRPAQERPVAPMPPAQGLALARTTGDEWRRSDALHRLTAYVRTLLLQAGRAPEAVVASGYEDTRACVAGRPAASGHASTEERVP